MFSQRNRELHKAIREGNYAKVIQCLDDGPKRERAQVLDQTNGMGSTPLTLACGFGQIRIITALLDRGAAIDKVNYSGRAPLFVSSMLNEVQTVELLLARGANIEKTNKKGFSPLHVACLNGSVDAARLLLDHGADALRKADTNSTPLHSAARSGHVAVVNLLFDRDIKDKYHGRGRRGSKALARACREGDAAMVRCLLARGVVVDGRFPNLAQAPPAIKAILDAAAPPDKRRLSHWINRIHLHVAGPRSDHRGSARHRILNCRHLARHLASFLYRFEERPRELPRWTGHGVTGYLGGGS